MSASQPAEQQMPDHRGAIGGVPAFEVLAVALGAVAGVAVRGEVELATAPELTAALDQGIRRSSGPFFIDLSAVGFLDSAGLQCVLRARAVLGRDDRPLALICPPGNVRRVLQIAGIDDLFPLYASRDELERALSSPRSEAARERS
jgi:anti-sigma B factor antagonist